MADAPKTSKSDNAQSQASCFGSHGCEETSSLDSKARSKQLSKNKW